MAKKINYGRAGETGNSRNLIELNKIASYNIRLQSKNSPEKSENRIAGYISLYNSAETQIGSITFFEDWVDIPPNKMVGTSAELGWHITKYPYIVDLLRNEGPLYLDYYNASGMARMTTKKEDVGEGE